MIKIILAAVGICAVVLGGYFYFSGADAGTFSDAVEPQENASSVGVVGPAAGDGLSDSGSDDNAGGDFADINSVSKKAGDTSRAAASARATAASGIDNVGTGVSEQAGGVAGGETVDGQDGVVSSPDGPAASGAIPSTPSSSAQSASARVAPQACTFAQADASSSTRSRSVILNEIAWMGSLPQNGETSAKAGEREWFELKNISSAAIDIAGWQIMDAAGNLKIVVGGTNAISSTKIPAGGFYLLVRDAASLGAIAADAGYSGGLTNAGDKVALFDAGCGTEDFLDASSGWPGGDNATKQTLERLADGVGWHTSAAPGGTPRAENSVPPAVASTSSMAASAAPVAPQSGATSSASSAPQAAPLQYLVSVSSIGAGTGAASSSPSGILCGFSCKANYAAGTKISFVAAAAQGSYFKGWSGPCSGAGVCSFTVTSTVAIVADFEIIETSSEGGTSGNGNSLGVASSSSGVQSATGAASPGQAPNHLVIAAVSIGGAASSNDFVKIFNPTDAAIDVSGWKLHKKSNTGTDYSLRTFPTGASVAPGGWFVWANSEGGYSDTIAANVSSTETLSADNSVALFDANGATVDQVAWGTGTGQYVEAAAYPTDPTANQVLTRKTENGDMVDTDNNAGDFSID